MSIIFLHKNYIKFVGQYFIPILQLWRIDADVINVHLSRLTSSHPYKGIRHLDLLQFMSLCRPAPFSYALVLFLDEKIYNHTLDGLQKKIGKLY